MKRKVLLGLSAAAVCIILVSTITTIVKSQTIIVGTACLNNNPGKCTWDDFSIPGQMIPDKPKQETKCLF